MIESSLLYDMLVLHVIRSMDPVTGGPCQGIRTSTLELEKIGLQREVVSLDKPTDSFVGHDPFPLHALGNGHSSWHYSPKLIPWLKENLKRFDIVVLNGLWLYQDYALLRVINYYKREGRKNPSSDYKLPKFFIMPHGMLDPYFQRATSRKFKAVRNWIFWKLLEQKVVGMANGLLFTTETELLLARDTFHPYKPKQEINVGYGVAAPPAYTPVMQQAFAGQCPAMTGQRYWLFLSRIHEKKGIDLLLTAYSDLLTESTAKGHKIPKLVIGGPGLDSVYGQKMARFVSANPALNDTVVFAGMLSGNAKWGAFYGCEAFILPSHQENFGIVVAEALACSKPVLITNQVNIWREIAEGESGLVADDSLDGVRTMLGRWVAMPDAEKQQMGHNARKTYDGNFAIGPVAQRFLQALLS